MGSVQWPLGKSRLTGEGRNRHLRFFESGRSNRKRRLPPHQTASGRVGRGAVIASGDLDRPKLADSVENSVFGNESIRGAVARPYDRATRGLRQSRNR